MVPTRSIVLRPGCGPTLQTANGDTDKRTSKGACREGPQERDHDVHDRVDRTRQPTCYLDRCVTCNDEQRADLQIDHARTAFAFEQS